MKHQTDPSKFKVLNQNQVIVKPFGKREVSAGGIHFPPSLNVMLGFGRVISCTDTVFNKSPLKKGDVVIYSLRAEIDHDAKPLVPGHPDKITVHPHDIRGIIKDLNTIRMIRESGEKNVVPDVKIDYRKVVMLGARICVRITSLEEAETKSGIKLPEVKVGQATVMGELLSWGPEIDDIVPDHGFKKGTMLYLSAAMSGGFVENAKDDKTWVAGIHDVFGIVVDGELQPFGPYLFCEPKNYRWEVFKDEFGNEMAKKDGGSVLIPHQKGAILETYFTVKKKGQWGSTRLPFITEDNQSSISKITEGDVVSCMKAILPGPKKNTVIMNNSIRIIEYENDTYYVIGSWLVDGILPD